MVSLLPTCTKFHEILFSSVRGVALTNCVTELDSPATSNNQYFILVRFYYSSNEYYVSPPLLWGDILFLSCPSHSLSAQLLWHYWTEFHETWYVVRTPYVVVHITRKFWSPAKFPIPENCSAHVPMILKVFCPSKINGLVMKTFSGKYWHYDRLLYIYIYIYKFQ
jgi:hypothetical protein